MGDFFFFFKNSVVFSDYVKGNQLVPAKLSEFKEGKTRKFERVCDGGVRLGVCSVFLLVTFDHVAADVFEFEVFTDLFVVSESLGDTDPV